MLTIITGISGSGRTKYVDSVVKFAEKKRKKIKVYKVGKMIFEHAKQMDMNITKDNILNTSPYTLKALRSAVFEKILAEYKKHKNVIIDMHGTIFWQKIFTNAYDWHYLQKLKPDMFITIMGNVPDLLKRHKTNRKWQRQKLTEDELLIWQNIEVNAAQGWSDLFNKPSYALSERQPPATLYKLIFHPEMEPVYASFPMTNLKDPVKKKKIVDFVKKLNDYFVVFDPATIELGPITGEVDAYQCVNRDLYWLVEQSKKVIAIFPEIVLSTGVINELREGYETNKEVWLIFPRKGMSPFTHYYSHKVFVSEEEMWEYMKKKKYKKIPNAN